MNFITPTSDRFINEIQHEVLFSPVMNKFKRPINYCARAPFDMEIFDNKLYFGYGDYDKNLGPCDLLCYDLIDKKFIIEIENVPTEQIDCFKIIDDSLYMLLKDHRFADTSEKLYRKQPGQSWEVINIPIGMVHSWNIIKFDSKLWICGDSGSSVYILCSSDNGITWSKINCYEYNGTTVSQNRRLYGFFVINNELYVTNTIASHPSDYQYVYTWKYDSTNTKFIKFDITVLSNMPYKYLLDTSFRGKVSDLHISLMENPHIKKYYNFNEYQIILLKRIGNSGWDAMDAANLRDMKYILVDEHVPEHVCLFNGEVSGYKPCTNIRDISPVNGYYNRFYVSDAKIYNNRFYVLGDFIYEWSYYDGVNPSIYFDCRRKHRIEIYSTEDFVTWTQHYSEKIPAVPFTFALHNNHAYIGIGMHRETNSPHCGEIWKVKLQNL